MPAPPARERPPARVVPLVPLAVAAVVAVAVDHQFGAWSTSVWVAIASILGAAGCVLSRHRVPGLVMVVLAVGALAGGWHHYRWWDVSADDLARVLDESPRPVWWRGVVFDVLGFRPGSGPDDAGVTRAVLEVAATCAGESWEPVSGWAILTIEGDRSDLRAGTPVEVAGNAALVAGPLNPGEFDYRAYLRAQGIRLRVSVDGDGVWESAAAASAARGAWWAGIRALGAVRAWSQARLARGLDPATAPLASALLLGRREGVDPDVNDAFARTGTTHLLAISGLHLQVLAWAMSLVFHVLGLSRRKTLVAVAVGTLAYSLLVGLMPSVVRSAAMTVTYCIAGLSDRPTRPANTLALAALTTLALNPAHLFDVGCQLSFLAIGAIAWGVAPVFARVVAKPDPLTAVERRFAPRWRRWGRWAWTWAVEGMTVSTVVWLAAVPLVLLRFHLLSPIGILLNVPLIPITSLALLAAGVSLGLSALWTPLGAPVAWVCSVSLKWTDAIVRWGAAQRWGYTFAPAPPWGWVLGFYVMLALAVAAALGRWPGRKTLAALTIALVPLGGWLTLRPGPRPPEADVLAVGHGLAIVVDTGYGHALLYDCGRMRDPSVGRRIVAPALWARGVRTIDSVILSHADADHYSGLPDLLDRFRVREVLVPPGFDVDPAAAALLGLVQARGVPVHTVSAGRMWYHDADDAEFLFQTRHPPGDWNARSATDNARSIVLEVTACGRSVLLTGDLDGPGLTAVTDAWTRSSYRWPLDVLLSPHHGGRTANPEWFYNKLNPALVVVSQRAPTPGTRDPLEPLADRGLPVLRTWQLGAIRLRWTAAGIKAQGFLDGTARESTERGQRAENKGQSPEGKQRNSSAKDRGQSPEGKQRNSSADDADERR